MQVLNSPCFEQGCDQESNERFDDRSVKEHQMNALDRKVPLLSAQGQIRGALLTYGVMSCCRARTC